MDHHDFIPCDVLPYSLKWFNYLSNITLYPIERVQKTAVTLKFCRRRRRKFGEKRSETQAIEQIAVRCVGYFPFIDRLSAVYIFERLLLFRKIFATMSVKTDTNPAKTPIFPRFSRTRPRPYSKCKIG